VALDDILEQRIGGRPRFPHAPHRRRFRDYGWMCMTAYCGLCRATGHRLKPDIFILWMVGSSLPADGHRHHLLPTRCGRSSGWRVPPQFGKAVPARFSSLTAPPKCAAPPRPSSPMRERIERHVIPANRDAAGVSHDIKTPLTRMKLTLAMMPDDARRRIHAP